MSDLTDNALDAADNELERLRWELRRAAEVIGAQIFDVPRLAKCRMKVMVALADELLRVADGEHVERRHYDRIRSSAVVRQRFEELRSEA